MIQFKLNYSKITNKNFLNKILMNANMRAVFPSR
jgi:hypothetical protein